MYQIYLKTLCVQVYRIILNRDDYMTMSIQSYIHDPLTIISSEEFIFYEIFPVILEQQYEYLCLKIYF